MGQGSSGTQSRKRVGAMPLVGCGEIGSSDVDSARESGWNKARGKLSDGTGRFPMSKDGRRIPCRASRLSYEMRMGYEVREQGGSIRHMARCLWLLELQGAGCGTLTARTRSV